VQLVNWFDTSAIAEISIAHLSSIIRYFWWIWQYTNEFKHAGSILQIHISFQNALWC